MIPTWNGERHLEETIESVVRQTFASWELVVYDDGSTDATIDVALRASSGDPRIRVVAGVNGGVARARNAALALTDARTPYVVFLDHDDVWHPEMLATVVGALDAHPEYVGAHAIASCIDENGHQPLDDDLEEFMRHRSGVHGGQLRPLSPDEPTTFSDLAYFNWILTPGTLVIRRAIADAVGGFDVDVVPADDWDMALRVSRRGDVGYIGLPLLRWRRHADAQSYASPGYGRAHLMVRHKMLIDRANTPAQLRAAREGYALMIRQTVGGAGRALAERRWHASARQGAKVLWQCGWYARGELTRWRVARSASGDPAR